MRQTGVLVGSVAYALTHNFPLLPKVHALAKRLQAGLEELQVGILSPAETCMVSPLSRFTILKCSDGLTTRDRFSMTPPQSESSTGRL
jgi:threonine aldolase